MSGVLNVIASYKGAASAPTGLLLDTYTSAAVAWSFRKLRTAYTGALCRVRRSSDNAERDFYQGATVGSLNTTAGGGGDDIATWVGANDGFIVTMYDQSGNAINATQSTTANQPKIVSTGTLLTAGGMPYMDFDGSNDHFNLGDVLDPAGSFTVFYAGKSDATDSSTFWAKSIAAGQANRIASVIDTNSHIYLLSDSSNADQNITETAVTTRCVTSQIFVNNTSYRVDRNNSNIGTDNSVGSLSGSSFSFILGGYNNGSDGVGNLDVLNLDGYIQEFIMWHSDQSSNRTAIRDNINGVYGIF
jgi:hypothetical protein